MNSQINVAILGCGYWGINYVRIFSELPESKVNVICDQEPGCLERAKQRFPNIKLTTDVETVLQSKEVDVAVVCTEATSHYDVTRQCLTQGKHVLVEKPMTTTVPDAEDLLDLARSNDKTLMVGHTFLYNPGIQRVKSCIEQDKLGQIYYLYARRTNLGPIRKDVNALWDLAPHDVSIFNYLLDSTPEWVNAIGAKVLRNSREDVGFITLGYPNGILGHIHVSWADPNKVREVVVVGSRKRVFFNDLDNLERVRIFEKGVAPTPSEAPGYGEYPFLMRDGDIISPKIEISEPLKNQARHFLTCVKENRQPLTGGKEGLDVVRILEAANQSLALRGAPITLA